MKSMKLPVVLTAVLLAGAAQGQYLETTIYLPDSLGGMRSPRVFAYSASSDVVYVGGDGGECVIAMDARTGERIARIPAGLNIAAVCWNSTNNKVYSANCGYFEERLQDSTVTIIDCATNQRIATLSLGPGPSDLLYDPVGNRVYCATCAGHEPWGHASDSLFVIDGSADTVIATLPAFGGIGGFSPSMALGTRHRKLYYTTSSSVVIVNCESTRVVGTLAMDEVTGLVYNDSNEACYCAPGLEDAVFVIDGVTNEVVDTIPMTYRPGPFALNSATNRLYVPRAFGLSVIDCGSNQVVAEIALPSDPGTPLFLPENRIFCTGDRAIFVIDGTTNEIVDSIPASWVTGLGFAPSCGVVYAGNTSNTITLIDGATAEPLSSVQVGCAPQALAVDSASGTVMCTSLDATADRNGLVSFVNAASNRLTSSLVVGDSSRSLLLAPWGKLYCANTGSNSITVIDPVTGHLTTTIPVGREPMALTCSPQSGKLYCANSGDDSITVIDGLGDSAVAVLPAGRGTAAAAHNATDNKAYFANELSNDLTVVDCATNRVTATVGTNLGPRGVAYNGAANKLYSVNLLGGSVAVIDGQTDTVVASVPIPDPFAVVADEAANVVCCAGLSDSLYFISGSGDSVVALAPIGPGGYALALDPARRRIYCTNEWDGTVTVVDADGHERVATIGVGEGPVAVACVPAMAQTYVANASGSSISVIRDTSSAIAEDREHTRSVMRLSAWPTPSNGLVRLDGCASPQAAAVVYTVSGRVVAALPVLKGAGATMLDLRSLPDGVYFVSLDDRPETMTKVVLSR